MKYLLVILSLISLPAFAGEVSSTGTAIEVENYRCEVDSPRTIRCMNIGRICENERAIAAEFSKQYLGCALDDWKKANPNKACPDKWIMPSAECSSTIFY